MLLRLLRVHLFVLISVLMTTMWLRNAAAKPQGPKMFEDVAIQALSVAGHVAEMAENGAALNKEMGFEMPFVKANSKTSVGAGAAAVAKNPDDDDYSDENRRKRSVDVQTIEDSFVGEEPLLALPHTHYHLHRSKRSPCHQGGGSGTSGGGEDVDVAERRRRANARKRQAAGKTNKKATASRKKKLINDDDNVVLSRRKRQSELDDLNQNSANGGSDFSQYAKQIAEQFRNVWQGFMNSMAEMTQKLKQHFGATNSTNTMEI